MTFTIPLRLYSEANQREHWAVKARRVKQQRHAVAWHWRFIRNTQRAAVVQAIDINGLRVTLTRIAPRMLDAHDNLPRAFKAVVDQLCEEWNVDDSCQSIKWDYDQRKGDPKQYAVEVTIEVIQ